MSPMVKLIAYKKNIDAVAPPHKWHDYYERLKMDIHPSRFVTAMICYDRISYGRIHYGKICYVRICYGRKGLIPYPFRGL